FGLLDVVARPVVVEFERIAVEMVRAVDPATGIGVLMPDTADIVISFDDLEVDPRLLEADARANARGSGADDQHLETGRFFPRAGTAMRKRRLRFAEAQVFKEHGEMKIGDVFTNKG